MKTFSNEMFNYIHVTHYTQKYDASSQNKIIHDRCKKLSGIFFVLLREVKRICCIPECLNEKSHENTELIAGTVNSQLLHSTGRICHQVFQNSTVECFIYHSGKSRNKQRESIYEHLFNDVLVDGTSHIPEFRNKEK